MNPYEKFSDIADSENDFHTFLSMYLSYYRKLRKPHRRIHLCKNFGQMNATLCGVHHAYYDYILTLDDDLQHHPEEIPKIIDFIQGGSYDVVYGVCDSKKDTWIKKCGSRFHYLLYRKIFRKDSSVQLSTFRIFGPKCTRVLRKFNAPEPLLHPLTLRTTDRIGNVTIHHDFRRYGKSGYGFRALFERTWNIVLYYSSFLIRWAIVLGTTGVFMMSLCHVCFNRSLPIRLQGLWVTLTLVGGLVIGMLGVIALYLQKMVDKQIHNEINTIQSNLGTFD